MRMRQATCGGVLLIVLSACTEPVQERLADPLGKHATSAALLYPCGAYIRMATYEEDTEGAAYGWPPLADTVDVCETWVGGDYRWEVRTIGSSELASGVYDLTRDGVYDAGTIRVLHQGTVTHSIPAGNTLFNSYATDPAEVQASYDDPYYAIRADGGCTSGSCTPSLRASESGAAQSVADRPDTLFTRHGLTRRGVRALVNDMQRTGISPEGFLEFRTTSEAGSRTILVHPARQVIMGEDMDDGDIQLKVRHAWRQTPTGFVMERSTMEARDAQSGLVTERVTIDYLIVRVQNP